MIEILHMLAQPPPLSDAAEATPDTWQTALDNALEYLDQEGAENVALAAPAIKKVFPDDPVKAGQVIAQMLASAERLSGGINQWFEFDDGSSLTAVCRAHTHLDGRFFCCGRFRSALGRLQAPNSTLG